MDGGVQASGWHNRFPGDSQGTLVTVTGSAGQAICLDSASWQGPWPRLESRTFVGARQWEVEPWGRGVLFICVFHLGAPGTAEDATPNTPDGIEELIRQNQWVCSTRSQCRQRWGGGWRSGAHGPCLVPCTPPPLTPGSYSSKICTASLTGSPGRAACPPSDQLPVSQVMQQEPQTERQAGLGSPPSCAPGRLGDLRDTQDYAEPQLSHLWNGNTSCASLPGSCGADELSRRQPGHQGSAIAGVTTTNSPSPLQGKS